VLAERAARDLAWCPARDARDNAARAARRAAREAAKTTLSCQQAQKHEDRRRQSHPRHYKS
jgi:hypothetical protein